MRDVKQTKHEKCSTNEPAMSVYMEQLISLKSEIGTDIVRTCMEYGLPLSTLKKEYH